jgi:hypothetical protein
VVVTCPAVSEVVQVAASAADMQVVDLAAVATGVAAIGKTYA